MTTSAEWAERLSGYTPDDEQGTPKQRFLIEWGYRGSDFVRDVIYAEDAAAARREADRLAEDLWESNKIAWAEPYEDNDGQPGDDNLPSDGGGADVHADRRGSGGGV